MSCVVTESIGVYMLGAVDERERAAMDAHLEGCAACRAAADELRPVPVLLSRVHVDDLARGVDDDVPPLAGRASCWRRLLW